VSCAGHFVLKLAVQIGDGFVKFVVQYGTAVGSSTILFVLVPGANLITWFSCTFGSRGSALGTMQRCTLRLIVDFS
jgi:hypothetical protein